jgi:hypothetical protein
MVWLSWLAYTSPGFLEDGQIQVATLQENLLASSTALISGALLLCMSWLGTRQSRSLIATIGVMSLICVWLATASYWPAIARVGKQHRLQGDLAAFETVAASLRSAWPTNDGDNSILGAFMAYPVGRPSVLIMLTLPEIAGIDASVIAVERGGDGQLRFQLAGRERGDWLEWHPQGSEPASFVGGLHELHELDRHDQIAEHWYLVTYRTATQRT